MTVGEIAAAVAVYGYNTTKLEEGKALYQQADALNARQKKEYGEQFDATDAMHLAKAKASKEYMRQLKLARIALEDERGLWVSMELSGERKSSFSGWLQQAENFYTNSLASPTALTALAEYRITEELLKANQLLVADVRTKYSVQKKEMGEAQDATEARDAALDQLQKWMSKFTQVARIALEDQPQYLEMLGIIVP